MKRLDKTIPRWPGVYRVEPGYPGLFVHDLDGDGEPEVVLRLDWSGTQCCAWWRIYRYVPGRRRYIVTVHMWGNFSAAPRIRDLNGDRRPELDGGDYHFSSLGFHGGPCYAYPVQIWHYRAGRLFDVTRRFPRAIESWARFYRREVETPHDCGNRDAAAAWAANEVSLGRPGYAHAQLLRWARAGAFSSESHGNGSYGPFGTRFVARVWRFLDQIGYLR